ncbi:HNH endonuclease [Prosthecobacter sp.]|uniref:HNH endonuclease n=1 Tax=Prosthecobacter sp. TaxID=1965333 RepID=UPI0037851FF4
MAVPASLRKRVVRRVKHRCEYCGLSDIGQAATFHVDHIIPQAAGGTCVLENLALACIHCSLRKGARQNARDPQTGRATRLFNPRKDSWNHHFRWAAFRLNGITAVGRATIDVLDLNSAEHQIIRTFEKRLRRHPPPGHL